MSHKDIASYRGRTAISFDFSAEEISSGWRSITPG